MKGECGHVEVQVQQRLKRKEPLRDHMWTRWNVSTALVEVPVSSETDA